MSSGRKIQNFMKIIVEKFKIMSIEAGLYCKATFAIHIVDLGITCPIKSYLLVSRSRVIINFEMIYYLILNPSCLGTGPVNV